ncbi:unnamed protein product [Zymoseptoria tritici ST99CH_1E4]|uniref:Uncharacterized protein n=1 Tax=Zymoseptoria tritici ST99CH_1E4 TaxID=1276532 RepID=A0A2H1G3J3_ZYMTR|nr:unnamed protein product [Zymoseptoria tritici ST99CH_1E4]
MAPTQSTWLTRLAIAAVFCACLLTIIPFFQKPSPHAPPALSPRANATADSSSDLASLTISSHLPKRYTYRPCDWPAAALAAKAAIAGEISFDQLDPCARMVVKGYHLLCHMNSHGDVAAITSIGDPRDGPDLSRTKWNAMERGGLCTVSC